jgi:hypothetical protein
MDSLQMQPGDEKLGAVSRSDLPAYGSSRYMYAEYRISATAAMQRRYAMNVPGDLLLVPKMTLSP